MSGFDETRRDFSSSRLYTRGGGTRYCPVCGQGIDALREPTSGRRAACPNRWCRRSDRGFSVVFSVGVHRDGLRQAITHYKYLGDDRLAGFLAGSLVTYVDEHAAWFEEFDVLTSVPSYRGVGARRTWDPVGTIMTVMAARLGASWDVVPDLVSKSCETPAMTGLTWNERQAVAQGPLRKALAVADTGEVGGGRILVVDDVFTDGSTLREVALTLLGAGATEVAGLVLARRAWTASPPGVTLTFGR